MSTERFFWDNITAADATDAEIDLVHVIFGDKPAYMSAEQWRDNLRSIAQHIRYHVKLQMPDTSRG